MDKLTFTVLFCGLVGIPALCVLGVGIAEQVRHIMYRRRKRQCRKNTPGKKLRR